MQHTKCTKCYGVDLYTSDENTSYTATNLHKKTYREEHKQSYILVFAVTYCSVSDSVGQELEWSPSVVCFPSGHKWEDMNVWSKRSEDKS